MRTVTEIKPIHCTDDSSTTSLPSKAQQLNAADNTLIYLGKIAEAQTLTRWRTDLLSTTQWNHSGYEAFGRWFDIPRQQAWIADPGIRYRYSDNLLENQDWTPLLLSIKHKVESLSKVSFNSVLLTLYRNGDDSVDWHSDDEKELGLEPTIVSLSLGQSRQFYFREKHTNHNGAVSVHDGDIWLMKPDFQKHWQHAILPEHACNQPRINLTFRNVVNPLRFCIKPL